MQSTISSKKAPFWAEFTPSIDRRLPIWARRSNPIVRRHLGVHWKVLPLEMDLLTRLMLAQFGLIAVSVVVPILLPLLFTVLPVALVLLPFLFLWYGRVLVGVGAFTVHMIVDEQHNHTMSLLRTTPMPLRHILYSKAAAGVWRQIEDLGLIVMGAVLLTLPVIGLQYAAYWPFEEASILSRLALGLGLVTCVVRLVVEPVMLAACAIAIGSIVPVRTPALLSLAGLGFFYFLLINLPRLLPLSPELRVLVEFVLPVLLPMVITVGAFKLAERVIRSD
ncbi:MAG: hypothetical protein K8J31_20075 [Anaerolineae bacterium]|nr:hypothetical protein [Anaerolineae bacterium]